MQVQGDKFVRYWPKTPTDGTNGFDCSPGNSMPMTKTLRAAPAGLRIDERVLALHDLRPRVRRRLLHRGERARRHLHRVGHLQLRARRGGDDRGVHAIGSCGSQHHWPAPLAFAAVLLVEAPIMGVVIERLIMRNLGGAATITNIVVTIGLLVTLLGIGSVVWAPSKFAVTPSLPRFYQANVVTRRGRADPVALLHRARHRRCWSRSACGRCSRAPASASRCVRSSTTATSRASTARTPTWRRPRAGSSAACSPRWPASCSRRSSRSTSPASPCS